MTPGPKPKTPEDLLPMQFGAFIPRSKIIYIWKDDYMDATEDYKAAVNAEGTRFAFLPKSVRDTSDVKTWWNAAR